MSIADDMKGKWPSILPIFIDQQYLTGKHTACPICQAGKDRFRFDDKEGRGTYFCAKCGSGDGFDLLMRATGKSFAEIAKDLEPHIGSAKVMPIKHKQNHSPVINKIVQFCEVVDKGDHVSAYLANRGLSLNTRNVRIAKHQPYYRDRKVVAHYDAMIARITDATGARNGLHITYLQDGDKAHVTPNRKILSAIEDLNGSFIALGPIEPIMCIGEGIETTLAGMAIHECSGLATINATLMKSVILPDEVKSVVILADNDRSFTGQDAAYALAKRLVNEGRTVSVEMPDTPDTDFADLVEPKRLARA